MNRIDYIGRLGNDIEIRKTADGTSVIEFSLADTEKVNGEERTTWLSCVAWGNKADTIQKYVRKGDMLFVSGKYRQDRYEKDGAVKYKSYCLVNNFELLPNARKESNAEDEPWY